MPRATNAVASRTRRKRRLDQAKGFYGSRSKLFRQATEAVDRAQALSQRRHQLQPFHRRSCQGRRRPQPQDAERNGHPRSRRLRLHRGHRQGQRHPPGVQVIPRPIPAPARAASTARASFCRAGPQRRQHAGFPAFPFGPGEAPGNTTGPCPLRRRTGQAASARRGPGDAPPPARTGKRTGWKIE